MKILILGGTGTISRYIVSALAPKGHELILLNHHEKDCGGYPNVRVELCDRKDYPAFIETCRRLGPFDCVYDMITFTPEDAQSSVEAFRGQRYAVGVLQHRRCIYQNRSALSCNGGNGEKAL